MKSNIDMWHQLWRGHCHHPTFSRNDQVQLIRILLPEDGVGEVHQPRCKHERVFDMKAPEYLEANVEAE